MKPHRKICCLLFVLCVLVVAFDGASQKKISMKKPAAATPTTAPRAAATARQQSPSRSNVNTTRRTTAPATSAHRQQPRQQQSRQQQLQQGPRQSQTRPPAPRSPQQVQGQSRQQQTNVPNISKNRRITDVPDIGRNNRNDDGQYGDDWDDDDMDDNYSRYNNRYNRNYDPRYNRGNDPRYDPRYDRGYDPRYDPRYNRGYDPRYDPRYNRNYDPRTIPTAPPQPEAVSNTERNEVITVKGVCFTMVAVRGGTFTMGATSEQGSDAFDDEKPTHSDTLSLFSIGQTEVTQELWEAVMGSNPSYYKGAKRPVERVSWDDCQEFIKKLNALTGKNFRLPTEAEWEFAARGGVKSRGYKYSGSNNIDDVAWYEGNSGSVTHDVGTKSSNELGLYDMSGNVWEWCADWYGAYSGGSQSNPHGSPKGSLRVFRGGGWRNCARDCRVSSRGLNYPDCRFNFIGFRLALSETQAVSSQTSKQLRRSLSIDDSNASGSSTSKLDNPNDIAGDKLTAGAPSITSGLSGLTPEHWATAPAPGSGGGTVVLRVTVNPRGNIVSASVVGGTCKDPKNRALCQQLALKSRFRVPQNKMTNEIGNVTYTIR